MIALAALQQTMRDAIVRDDDLSPGMAIYRHTYRMQLMTCMAETFPVLAAELGEDAFSTLIVDYALQCPPVGWSLDHFPARFADWLEQRGESFATIDLANLEWALAECFAAPDLAPLTISDLPLLDWDTVELSLVPCAHLLALASSANVVWRAHQQGDGGAAAAQAAPHVLIARKDHECYMREVDGLEAALLGMLPARFTSLCAHASAALGEAAGIDRVGALLAGWLADALISARDQPGVTANNAK